MSILEKGQSSSPDTEPAQPAGIFLESYPVTSEYLALLAIQSRLKQYQLEYGDIRQIPGPELPDGTKTIEVWR